MAKYVKLEFREQSGLQIIDLGVGSHLQRILIEPLVEGLQCRVTQKAECEFVDIVSSIYSLTLAW